MVRIIDIDDDMGWDNIFDEAGKMADQYGCIVQAVSKGGKKKNFGEKTKFELLEGTNLSGKQFSEFTPEEIGKMSNNRFWREKAKQCVTILIFMSIGMDLNILSFMLDTNFIRGKVRRINVL